MKKIILSSFITIVLFTNYSWSQNDVKGSGEISRKEFALSEFNTVIIQGGQEAILKNGDIYQVAVETNANLQDRVNATVNNQELQFNLKGINSYSQMKFYITAPNFEKIVVNGASDANSEGILKGGQLKIVASGASDIRLNVNYEQIETVASGASNVILNGNATVHNIRTSGASTVKAGELETDVTTVNASGASNSFVNAASSLTYTVSGASNVKYTNKPQTLIIQNETGSENLVIVNDSAWNSSVYNYHDTTKVNVGPINVEVYDGDTTVVSVGRHTLIVDEDGNVKYERNRSLRFNGNWGGVEIGLNGYVTPEFNTNWGAENDYLNLQYENSIAVNLNVFEQNFALNKDKNMGIITGFGMGWNNYRFSQQTELRPDTNIAGFFIVGTSVRKTKLTAMYLTVPVLWEIQTKNINRFKRFHFTAGGLISARVRTHTKIFFNEANSEYSLRIPGTENEYLPGTFVTPNASNRNIVKNFNSFYLQPFKFDATIRFGYGIINLFATYSLNTLFQKDRGPELYAWTAGITLLGW